MFLALLWFTYFFCLLLFLAVVRGQLTERWICSIASPALLTLLVLLYLLSFSIMKLFQVISPTKFLELDHDRLIMTLDVIIFSLFIIHKIVEIYIDPFYCNETFAMTTVFGLTHVQVEYKITDYSYDKFRRYVNIVLLIFSAFCAGLASLIKAMKSGIRFSLSGCGSLRIKSNKVYPGVEAESALETFDDIAVIDNNPERIEIESLASANVDTVVENTPDSLTIEEGAVTAKDGSSLHSVLVHIENELDNKNQKGPQQTMLKTSKKLNSSYSKQLQVMFAITICGIILSAMTLTAFYLTEKNDKYAVMNFIVLKIIECVPILTILHSESLSTFTNRRIKRALFIN